MFDVKELISNINLERVDELNFRGTSLDMPLPVFFGGQVLAQTLRAGMHTVDQRRIAHSMHAYFLSPGDVKQEIIYEVEPIRDGSSFTTCRVVAKQKDKLMLNATISFQIREEGFEHQIDMPDNVPPPESLENDADRNKRLGSKYGLLRNSRLPRNTDFRSVNPPDEKNLVAMEPIQGYWVKFNDNLVADTGVHQSLLAYVSDLNIMSTGIRPHYASMDVKQFQGASLDHSLWFHADFRVDQWLYYHMDSPRAAQGRNFSRGSFYTREGVLVASSAQEGMMRLRKAIRKED